MTDGDTVCCNTDIDEVNNHDDTCCTGKNNIAANHKCCPEGKKASDGS